MKPLSICLFLPTLALPVTVCANSDCGDLAEVRRSEPLARSEPAPGGTGGERMGEGFHPGSYCPWTLLVPFYLA